MSSPPQPDRPASRTFLVPLVLIAVLAVFPPETRGEARAGASALLLLLAAVAWVEGRLPVGTRRLVLLAGAVAVVPAWWLAVAPGAVAEPWAELLLAAWAGLLAAECTGDRRGDTAAAAVLAATGVVVAGHGLWQAFGGLDALAERLARAGASIPDSPALLERARAGRAFAAFPTPAALGGYLALALPATVGAAVGRRAGVRWPWAAAAAVQAGGLAASRSATAAGALAAAVVLWAALRGAFRRRAAVAAVVAGAALLAVVAGLRGSEILDVDAADSPWRLRAGNARIAAEMIADRPWVGTGPGGFAEAYPRYRRPHDNESRHVHDLPLELAAEWGLPVGLALAAAAYALLLGPLLARGRPPWRQGVAVGLAALALQNLGDFTLLLPSILWTATILRGMLAEPSAPGPARPSWAVGALAGLIAAAAVSASAGVAQGLVWEARVARAEGDAARSRGLALRAAAWAPWDPNPLLIAAGAGLAGPAPPGPRRLTAIEDEVGRAVDRSPVRPSARILRARVRLLRGDLAGAWVDARTAAALYPADPDYARTRDGLAARLAALEPGPGP